MGAACRNTDSIDYGQGGASMHRRQMTNDIGKSMWACVTLLYYNLPSGRSQPTTGIFLQLRAHQYCYISPSICI
jgi:hypothetical protein